ncbi:MAG: TetR/AcrR family transcriptional regulator [Saprospiraceae bacterium]
MITQQERIIHIATKLFLKNGVKSVTINRIVKELHTSKRTVYKHFPDKTALLKACLAVYHEKVKTENEAIIADSENAIAAMGNLLQQIIRRANVVNPNFFNDILHYYPGLLNESYRNTGNFAHKIFEDLAHWGIAEGIFDKDVDVEVTVKTVLNMLKLLKDTRQFPVEEFSKERLTFGILIPYMKGVCTTKGLEILEMQEELFRVTL